MMDCTGGFRAAFVGGSGVGGLGRGSGRRFEVEPQRRRGCVWRASSARDTSLTATKFEFKDVDNRVIKAVEKLGDRRLTVSDVASTAGLGFEDTERELLQLAQLTSGKLEVSWKYFTSVLESSLPNSYFYMTCGFVGIK